MAERRNRKNENMLILYMTIYDMTVDCATVEVIASDICTWITYKGGRANLAAIDIMTLVSAYLGQTNLGFTVTIDHITGSIYYYADNPSSGDSLTGCLHA